MTIDNLLCKACEAQSKGCVNVYEDDTCFITKKDGIPMLVLKAHTDHVDAETYLNLVGILKDICGGGVIAGPKTSTNHFHMYLIK